MSELANQMCLFCGEVMGEPTAQDAQVSQVIRLPEGDYWTPRHYRCWQAKMAEKFRPPDDAVGEECPLCDEALTAEDTWTCPVCDVDFHTACMTDHEQSGDCENDDEA